MKTTTLQAFARILLVGVVLTVAQIANAADAKETKGRYDFNYMAEGVREAKPIQVFDDGTFTFFQFSAGQDAPSIFSIHKGREKLEPTQVSGPYVAVRGINPHYELRMGDATATVKYRGYNERTGRIETDLEKRIGAAGFYMAGEAAPSEVSEGGKLIDRSETTYKVPFRKNSAKLLTEGKANIAAMASKVGAHDQIFVYARPDKEGGDGVVSKRAEAIYAELVRHGVAASRITSREVEATRPENGLFYSEVLVRTGAGPKTVASTRRVIADRYLGLDGERTGAVFYEGREPAIKSAARGMGRDIPIRDVLQQIVPPQYQIYNDGVNLDHPVSWTGNKDWTRSLHEVVRQAGISAVVNWDERSVSFLTHVPESLARRAGVSQGSWDIARTDGFISKTLTRWGRKAGWQVSWDASNDFPVTVEATFPGTFEDAVGQVVQALAGTDYPIRAVFHSNNVVQITRYTGNATETIGSK